MAVTSELVSSPCRILLIKKTGSGKSFVYFIATKLLREQSSGPNEVKQVIAALEQVPDGLSIPELTARLNLGSSHIDNATKLLALARTPMEADE